MEHKDCWLHYYKSIDLCHVEKQLYLFICAVGQCCRKVGTFRCIHFIKSFKRNDYNYLEKLSVMFGWKVIIFTVFSSFIKFNIWVILFWTNITKTKPVLWNWSRSYYFLYLSTNVMFYGYYSSSVIVSF